MTDKADNKATAANKILTVVIPTYNMEKYLRRCLDSLIVSDRQMQMLEVLVINDGSKDTSSQIAHEYQDRYPQTFRVIDKENGNYGSCINRGLKEATGKYIKILDADDWQDKIVFPRYMNILLTVDVDLVLNGMVWINPEGKILKKEIQPTTINTIFEFYPASIMPRLHQLTYKTENLLRINYKQTEGVSYTDQQWGFMPMSTVKTAYNFPEYMTYYLLGREGQTMSRQVRLKSISHKALVLEDMLKMYGRNNYTSDIDNWMKTKLFACIRGFYKSTLIDFKDDKNKSLLEFDSFFASFPQLYKESEQIFVSPWLKYHFISVWRKNKSLPMKNILNLIYVTYLKIFGKGYLLN